MPNRNDFRPSRSIRKKEERLNRFLNWAITAVIACILAVGGYLFVSVLHAPAEQKASDSASTNVQNKSTSDQSGNTHDKKHQDDQGDQAGNASGSAGSGSSDGDQASGGDEGASNDGAYNMEGGGPQGPWHPIGTVQKEPHHTDYIKGSVDWNERVKALLYATGLSEDDYILWRLENGGSPDKSRGVISSKENPEKKYVVLLQWVTGKGWKPISVTIQ